MTLPGRPKIPRIWEPSGDGAVATPAPYVLVGQAPSKQAASKTTAGHGPPEPLVGDVGEFLAKRR